MNGRPQNFSHTPPNRKMDRAFAIKNKDVGEPISFHQSHLDGLTVQENLKYLEMLENERRKREGRQ